MRRASFKIQKVLDEVRERQAMVSMRERKMTMQRQKSGCENPFFPVQHDKPGEEIIHLVTSNDTLEPDDYKTLDEYQSVGRIPEDKIDVRPDRARKYSVIMEEMDEKVEGRREREEIMQPIKHLSGTVG